MQKSTSPNQGLSAAAGSANGIRKEFALKTPDYDVALQKALKLDKVADAPTQEIAFAQINVINGYAKQTEELPLSEIWSRYSVHPDRARPLTPHEPLMYQSTLREFIEYAFGQKITFAEPFRFAYFRNHDTDRFH